MKRIIIIVLLSWIGGWDAAAQMSVDNITSQFRNWQKSFPQVKTFAFFNQGKYAPGDTAFFKTYLLTESLAKVGGRQILQLSVVNSAGKEVGHSNFGVRDGVGHDQFVLPDSLSSGFYRFTIYNDWMRNFSSSLFFQEEVEIVKKNKIKAIAEKVSRRVGFFPEGGTLVAGVSNKVILLTEGFANASGDLVDDKSNIVTSFHIDGLGLGSIVFSPRHGVKYAVKMSDQVFDLPLTQSEGLALLLTPHADRGPMRMVLTAPANSIYRKQELALIFTSRGEIYYSASVTLENKEFLQLMIPQTALPEGIARLSILTNTGKVLATRLFFVKGDKEVKVSIDATPQDVNTRQKISLDVALMDESGNPLTGEFSVAVLNGKLVDSDSMRNFRDYLNIFSEVGYANPFERSPSSEFIRLDHWLITQKGQRFDWDKILSSPVNQPKYQMSTLLSKKGRAFDLDTNQPAADSTLIMIYLQKHMMGYETHTTSNGQFELPFLFDFWGDDEIFYLSEFRGRENGNVRIAWLEDDVFVPSSRRAEQMQQEDVYANFAFRKKLVDKSFHFYSKTAEVKPDLTDPNAEFEDEVSGVDVTVNVQDYIIFPTMIELIREIIPSLQHRKLGGKTTVRVLLSEASIRPIGDPLYVIDGIMTKNTDYFLSMNPSDILTLKIVKDISKLRRFGAMGKNGMVLIQTKKLDLQKLKSGSTTLPVTGLSRPVDFRPLDHSNDAGNKLPDFRSTLYWAPTVKTAATGKANFSFYASDDTGPLVIKVLGMTADGRPFNASTRINVSFDSGQGRK